MRLGTAGALAVLLVSCAHSPAAIRRQAHEMRDRDFLSYDAHTQAWKYTDPLAGMAPMFDGAALEFLPTQDSLGNATYSRRGDLYATLQSLGRDGHAPSFHLGKWNAATSKLEPWPSAEYQQRLGSALGIRVVSRPRALGGDGELLIVLDWLKSQFVAIDLSTGAEVFRFTLPRPPIQALLPFTVGTVSMHNDVVASFDFNPDGTFFITDPPANALGVFCPDWKRPEASTYTKVLRNSRATRSGTTGVTVGGRQIKVLALKLFGAQLFVPLRSGADSVAYTPQLQGRGPHVLVSPLTPEGAALLWAIPANLDQTGDPREAVREAVAHGLVRPIARVPINDGLEVATIRGRQYLFGSDVQNSGAFVVDLATMKAVPLVRDRRTGWADGMAVRVDEAAGKVKVTFSNSGLGHTMGGEPAPPADRGLYSLTIGIDALLQRLEAEPPASYNDQL